MARPRTDNRLSHQLEAEEQKTPRSSKTKMDRVNKGLDMLGILDGEELVMGLRQMEGSGGCGK